jgi:hypothetical protein
LDIIENAMLRVSSGESLGASMIGWSRLMSDKLQFVASP